MSRDTLIKLLTNHACYPELSTYGGFVVECNCTKSFDHIEEWARHVANAIYPE